MPRIVNFADRLDAMKEAVYLVTLREGAGAVSIARVAEELHTSPATVRRSVRSMEMLPALGVDWVSRARQRRRFHLASRHHPRTAEERWLATMAYVEAELPVDDVRAAECLVWHRLTPQLDTQHTDVLVTGRRDYLGHLADSMVKVSRATVDRTTAPGRLRVLFAGLEGATVAGWLTHEQVAEELAASLPVIAPRPRPVETLPALRT